MFMKTLKFFAIAISVAVLTFSGCKKDDEGLTTDDMIQDAKDEASADDAFDDAVSQADRYDNGLKSDFDKDKCAPSVNISQLNSYPRTITIDFGSEGCEGTDQRMRKGKIIINATAPFYEANSVRTITLENYYVDDFKIEGKRTVTNMGTNTDGKQYHTVVLEGGKITSPEDEIVTREANRTRVWIEGDDTPYNILDDKWSITGSATGTNRRGEDYTANITEPLIFSIGCRWKLVQGKVAITIPEHSITINYGTGDCDNTTLVTIDGVEHTVNRTR